MAAKPLSIRFPHLWFATATLLLATKLELCAQNEPGFIEIGLDQATARSSGSYTPARLNEKVLVRGSATSRVLRFAGYSWLPIQNDSGNGIFIEDSGTLLDRIEPGDQLEASGTIDARGGMPVVKLQSVVKHGSSPTPEPRRVSLADLDGFRWLGTLVSTDGVVRSTGAGSSGAYFDIQAQGRTVRVYYPSGNSGAKNNWHFQSGDRIRVTGFSSQYCPIPPHDRFFQVIVNDQANAVVLESAWVISPYVLLALLGLLVAGFMIWFTYERRWAEQRKVIRSLNALSEEILSCKVQADVLRKLRESLPKSMKVSLVRMYLYNRTTQNLDRVGSIAEPALVAASIDADSASPFAGAALAFRSRTLLTIPDVRSSPVFTPEAAVKLDKSMVYIPMIASGDIAGVIELVYKKGYRKLSNDEQICAQHLGNQVAAALKLMHQQAIQNQLLRSEKLAAAGQLISGIAAELKNPLASIESLARNLLRQQMDSLTERDLRSITSQASHASEIVSRLIGFSRADKVTPTEVPMNAMLHGLLQFRGQELLLRGIKVEQSFPQAEVAVLGNQGQLEQVFLNLLLYAEQQQTTAEERCITVTANSAGKKVVVGISFSTAPEIDPEQDPLLCEDTAEKPARGLAFARGIFHAHGGEVRFLRNSSTQARFEVELPTAGKSAPIVAEAKSAIKTWTTLVVEPDGAVQRKLLSILSAHGHRVVPVTSAEEAINLLERLRFDLAFCSVRLPGRNWIDFYEAVRHRLASFVLLTEGIDEGLVRVFEGADGHLLRKPIDEADVEQLLSQIEN